MTPTPSNLSLGNNIGDHELAAYAWKRCCRLSTHHQRISLVSFNLALELRTSLRKGDVCFGHASAKALRSTFTKNVFNYGDTRIPGMRRGITTNALLAITSINWEDSDGQKSSAVLVSGQHSIASIRYTIKISPELTTVGAQVGLTLAILLTVVFILGFVADPIINFALDPYSSLMPFSFSSWGSSSRSYYDEFIPAASSRGRRHRSGWIEHFTKGFASLGLASFLKFMFTSPIQFLFRSSGMGGRRTGQDRLNTITWIMVAVGVATFLWVSH